MNTTIKEKTKVETKQKEKIKLKQTFGRIRSEFIKSKTVEELKEISQLITNLCPFGKLVEPEEDLEFLEDTDLNDVPPEEIIDNIEIEEEYHSSEEEQDYEDKFSLDEEVFDSKITYQELSKNTIYPIADVSSFHGTEKEAKEILSSPEKYIVFLENPSYYILIEEESKQPFQTQLIKLLRDENEKYIRRFNYYLSRILYFQREFFQSESLIEGYKKMKTMPQNKFLKMIEEKIGSIPEEYKIDYSTLTRMFQDKYISTHLGIISISDLFPVSKGNSELNSIQIIGHILDYIKNNPSITGNEITQILEKYGVSRSDVYKKLGKILRLPLTYKEEVHLRKIILKTF